MLMGNSLRLSMARIRFDGGTYVAISQQCMRASEIITIYLAAGAPFGVSYFLQEKRAGGRVQLLMKATGATLFWPLTAAIIFLARMSPGKFATDSTAQDRCAAQADKRVEQARRKLLAALYRINELVRGPSGQASEELEQATRMIGESIEKYVGLTLVAAEIDFEAAPDEREMELCRIAGRRGDDLLLAGRCIHRRNASRLMAHQAQARTELLHALASVREFGNDARFASFNSSTARDVSAATLKFYGHAINLLSLLEDESAATSAARLLNAECARLRRLESENVKGAREGASGGEECRTQLLHPTPASLLTGETLAQG